MKRKLTLIRLGVMVPSLICAPKSIMEIVSDRMSDDNREYTNSLKHLQNKKTQLELIRNELCVALLAQLKALEELEKNHNINQNKKMQSIFNQVKTLNNNFHTTVLLTTIDGLKALRQDRSFSTRGLIEDPLKTLRLISQTNQEIDAIPIMEANIKQNHLTKKLKIISTISTEKTQTVFIALGLQINVNNIE